MPHALCEIYQDLDDFDVHVFNCPMVESLAISSQDGYVGIDEAKIETNAEMRTVLMHEVGHFDSGAFYLPYSPFVIREQAEYRANKSAILRYIPEEAISACVLDGITELWEFADFFNVTEQFMLQALLYYQERRYANL